MTADHDWGIAGDLQADFVILAQSGEREASLSLSRPSVSRGFGPGHYLLTLCECLDSMRRVVTRGATIGSDAL